MNYPFSAVVGQPRLTTALLVDAVDPRIGGVLVRGHKGTAKSTAVRGLAALLPTIEVTVGCAMNCPPAAPAPDCQPCRRPDRRLRQVRTPLVELPVGAGEDQLIGSIDLERALTDGVRSFQPGLLARAHRGVLYVDEVNLLDDHLVDVLLDAAAMGVNHVEREGVSVRHPARFQLIGTMNPEEGELRPQLLDRFGLTVEVTAPADPGQRAEVVRRRLAYEAEPDRFADRFAGDERELANRLASARRRLPDVLLSEAWLERIVAVCAAFDVDGLRADIVTARTAMALAAWDGLTAVTRAQVRLACLLSLPHRRRRGPFDDPGIDEQELDRLLDQDPPPDGPPPAAPDPNDPAPGDPPPDGSDPDHPDRDDPASPPHSGPTGSGAPPPGGTGDGRADPEPDPVDPSGRSDRDAVPESGSGMDAQSAGPAPSERVTAPAPATAAAPVLAAPDRRAGTAGRRSPGPTIRGASVRTRRFRPQEPVRAADLALAASLRAAAGRGRARSGRVRLHRDDLRRHERRGRQGHLIVLCVDASGSMGARQRMAMVKGAVRSLLVDAYQRRDLVALVTFRGDGAQLTLPPTAGVELAERHLTTLPTGGRTPLAAGLRCAGEVVARHARRDPGRRPLLVAVTDGRANAGADPIVAAHRAAAWLAGLRVPALVIDTEQGFVRTGLAAGLASRLAAPCVSLGDFAAGGLARTIRLATGQIGPHHSGSARRTR